ncbi:MAG: SRPBCC family protein [Candidatus Jettenia sp.]|nr:MAG: SRPBCC family protein [Candidatus Jettenia sp. AMX1]MBC6930366.1 SRPBCC family protein [Candidatus Jettenia sp.]MCE7881962.1 SRPBCC family protein [Candidatus Jettenia sp. AMX1]MCQ3928520.1 SRPBCC family protein [Candidatus Jettenia sp.]MDL1940370.1 SRPBCC family protein [Candidatus Jettenia sp. AMX1]
MIRRGKAVEKIEKSIEVNVPVHLVYSQWTEFEAFPRFMGGVKEVKKLDDNRLRWRAEIRGKEVEWDARITRQTPDEVIAWVSISGIQNCGTVTFKSTDQNKTRITLIMEIESKEISGNTEDFVRVVSGQIEGDMKHFKEFIEERGEIGTETES